MKEQPQTKIEQREGFFATFCVIVCPLARGKIK